MDLDAATPLEYQIPMEDPTASGEFRRRSVIETFHLYVKGQALLGVLHLIDGCVVLGLGGVLMWLTMNSVWAALVLLVGTLFAVTGLTTIVLRQRHMRSVASLPCFFNICSLLTSVFVLTVNGYGIYLIETDIDKVYPNYRFSAKEILPLQVIHSLLLAGSLIEISACVMCIHKLVGVDCRRRGKKGVFTVPFEDLEESEPRGPDVLPDARQRPVLQINWMEGRSVQV